MKYQIREVDTKDFSYSNTDLYKISKLTDLDDSIFGNTAMRTFSGSKILALFDERDEVVGYISYHTRRDKITSLWRICVRSDMRLKGIGRYLVQKMIEDVKGKSNKIVAKCPSDISANIFYKNLGFTLVGQSLARTGRYLNIWELTI